MVPALIYLSPMDKRKIMQAKRLLEEFPEKRIGIRRLSRMVITNENKVKQGFKFLLGTSPGAYSKKVRMTRAMQLLSEKKISIQEVAEECGYRDRQNFSIAFKKYWGNTPGYYKGMGASGNYLSSASSIRRISFSLM